MDSRLVFAIIVAFAAPLAAVGAWNFDALAGVPDEPPSGQLLYFYAPT